MPSSPKVHVFVVMSVCNWVRIFCLVASLQLITFTVVSLVQPENILPIILTLEVLNDDMSREVNELQ